MNVDASCLGNHSGTRIVRSVRTLPVSRTRERPSFCEREVASSLADSSQGRRSSFASLIRVLRSLPRRGRTDLLRPVIRKPCLPPGFLIPFGLGYAAGILAGLQVGAALFIGMAMAATSLATKSRILIDRDLLDTRIAGVLLGGALVADVGVLVAFAGVLSFVELGTVDIGSVGLIIGKTLAFFVIAIAVGDRLLPPAWDWFETQMERYGFVDKTAAFTVALMISLAFALLAVAVDLHMIIGGFVARLFLRQANIHEDIYNGIYDLAIGVFALIFFVTVGFDLTLDVFTQDLLFLVVLVVVAFVSKIVGCWLFALPTELTSREGFVVGLGMNGRGAVEIVIAAIGLAAGIIDTGLFSILVFIAVFTMALVPSTMKWGIEWLDRAGELVVLDQPADIPE